MNTARGTPIIIAALYIYMQVEQRCSHAANFDAVTSRECLHFEGTVLRSSASTMLIQNKEVDSPNPPREILIGSDWSNFRSFAGKETVAHRPFTFPMSIGKTWDLEFTDDHPNNKNHKSETRKLKYRVVGWENVEVPAGKFKALKIEAEVRGPARSLPKRRQALRLKPVHKARRRLRRPSTSRQVSFKRAIAL